MGDDDLRNNDEDEMNTLALQSGADGLLQAPATQSMVGSEDRTLDVQADAGGIVQTPATQSIVGSEDRTLDVQADAVGTAQAQAGGAGEGTVPSPAAGARKTAAQPPAADSGKTGRQAVTKDAGKSAGQMPSKDENWAPGKVIDGLYLIERVIKGGMGRLYFVRHLRWGVTLAVKSPLQRGAGDQILKRFLREADAWVDLDKHPNIATAFYVREYKGIPRIFIEYVDGGSLAQWIKGSTDRPLESIVDKALQFCEAMIHAHGKGLVHRDIKPDNVLLTSDGTVKVTDFGLVKTHSAAADAAGPSEGAAPGGKPAFISQQEWQTMAGAKALGTPPYMPPEQWIAADQADHRADIYSFGVMLFEMLCGRRPFEMERDSGASPIVAFQVMHRFSAPPRPSELRKDIPAALESLIMKCLEKEREKRPQSFSDVKAALLPIYEAVTGGAYPRRFAGAAELRSDDLNNRALSYIDLGRYDEAAACFQQALILDPLSIPANINLILFSIERGFHSYDEIKKRFKALAEGNRESPLPPLYEALYEHSWGSQERALEFIEEALRKGPSQAAAHSLHGVILRALGRPEQAQAAFTKAFSMGKDRSDSLHNYGMSLYDRSLYRDAAAAFAEGARREPQETMWLIDLAFCYAAAGNTEQAGKYLIHSISRNPGDLRALLAFGEIFAGKSPKDAMPALEKARTLAPHLPSLKERYTEGRARLSMPVVIPDNRLILDPAIITSRERELLKPIPGQVIKPEREGGKLHGVDLLGQNQAVSISGDSLLELWDLHSGAPAGSLSDQESRFKCEGSGLSVSHDGRFIATAHSDRIVRIWEVQRGVCRTRLKGHENLVRAVAFSPDSSLLASAGAGGNVIVRKSPGFEPHATIDTRSRNIFALSFFPDSDRLALATHEGAILIVSALKGETVSRLTGHGKPALCASVTTDGLFAVSGGEDGCIRIWDITTGACARSIECGKASVESLAVSPWGLAVAAGMSDGSVRLWDIAKGECIRTFMLHKAPVTGLAYSKDGRRLVSGGRDGAICFIPLPFAGDSAFQPIYRKEFVISRPRTAEESITDSLSFQKLMRQGDAALADSSFELAYSLYRQALDTAGHDKDRRALAAIVKAGRQGSRVGVRNLWQRSEYHDYSGQGEISAGGCRNLITYPDSEGLSCLTGIESGAQEHITGPNPQERISSLHLSFDGKSLLSGYSKGVLELRDISEAEGNRPQVGPVIASMTADQRFSAAVLFPGGRYCATGGSTVVDSTIRIWELETGKCLISMPGHVNGTEALSLSSDGKRLLSGGADRMVKLWDTKTGSLIAEMAGHTLAVSSCRMAPDGRTAASGSKDGTIRLWDTAPYSSGADAQPRIASQARALKVKSSAGRAVTSLAFSPESRYLLAGYGDGSLSLLWADTLEEVRAPGRHGSEIISVAFSGDGRFMASGSGDGKLIIWEVDWEWDFSGAVREEPEIAAEPFEIEEKEHFTAVSDEAIKPAATSMLSNIKKLIPMAAAAAAAILIFSIPSCIKGIQMKEARDTVTAMSRFYMDVEEFKAFGRSEDILFSKGEAAVDALLERSVESSDSAVKLMCLIRLDSMMKTRSAFREYASKKASKPLCRLLSAPEPAVRGKAAGLLGDLKITGAGSELKKALEKEKAGAERPNIIGRGEYDCKACHGETMAKLELAVCRERSMKSKEYVISQIEEALKKL